MSPNDKYHTYGNLVLLAGQSGHWSDIVLLFWTPIARSLSQGRDKITCCGAKQVSIMQGKVIGWDRDGIARATLATLATLDDKAAVEWQNWHCIHFLHITFLLAKKCISYILLAKNANFTFLLAKNAFLTFLLAKKYLSCISLFANKKHIYLAHFYWYRFLLQIVIKETNKYNIS